MQNTLLILSYVGKAAGFIASLNAIPFVSPSTGIIIFFVASLVKDTVNRIGDFLDHSKADPGSPASGSAPAPVGSSTTHP